jgi:hypothetical protein
MITLITEHLAKNNNVYVSSVAILIGLYLHYRKTTVDTKIWLEKFTTTNNDDHERLEKNLTKVADVVRVRFDSMDEIEKYLDEARNEVANGLIYIRNKNIRQFVSRKFDKVLDISGKIYTLHWESKKGNFAVSLLAEANKESRLVCEHLLGEVFANQFYELQDKRMAQFLFDVDKIFKDKVNDRNYRYHLTVVKMIQDSISDVYEIADKHELLKAT